MKILRAVAGLSVFACLLLIPLRTSGSDTGLVKTLEFEYPVRSLAISSDGKLLAVGEEPPAKPAAVHVWYFPACKRLFTFRGHKHVVSGLAFLQKDTLLVSAGYDERLIVWDVRKGKKVASLDMEKSIYYILPCGDASLVVKPHGHQTEVWDFSDPAKPRLAKEQPFAKLERSEVSTFSPNAKFSAQSIPQKEAAPKLLVRETKTGKTIDTFETPWTRIGSLALSPDGKIVAAGLLYESKKHGLVHVWDARTGKKIAEFFGHKYGVQSLAFSPDSRYLASGDHPGYVRLWDLREKKEVKMIAAHQDLVISLLFTPDGEHLVTASHDGKVKVWDMKHLLK